MKALKRRRTEGTTTKKGEGESTVLGGSALPPPPLGRCSVPPSFGWCGFFPPSLTCRNTCRINRLCHRVKLFW